MTRKNTCFTAGKSSGFRIRWCACIIITLHIILLILCTVTNCLVSFSNWNSQNLTAGRSNILGSILATYRACLAVALLMLDYANAGFSRLSYFKQWLWGNVHPKSLDEIDSLRRSITKTSTSDTLGVKPLLLAGIYQMSHCAERRVLSNIIELDDAVSPANEYMNMAMIAKPSENSLKMMNEMANVKGTINPAHDVKPVKVIKAAMLA
jgi:hypothetical protein